MKSKLKSKLKWKVLMAFLILIVSTTQSWALIGGLVVYDPKLDATLNRISLLAEKSKYEQFTQTLLQLKNQYDQAKEMQVYWQTIHGNWKDPLKILQNAQVTAATVGVKIDQLGWLEDKFRKAKEVQGSADAIANLQDILKGNADQNKWGDVRKSVETLYSDVPITEKGAKVELAYQKIAEVTAFAGETNKAITESLKDIKTLEDKLSDGNTTPGDLQRYQQLLDVKKVRLQTLQLQASNYQNQLTMLQVGNDASNEAEKEKNRLKDRENQLSIAGMTLLSPAMVKNTKGEE